MVRNIDRAIRWFDMAMNDLKVSKISLENKFYPQSVYHSQQSGEKSIKALLSFLDIEFKKTHFVSMILKELVVEDEDFQREKGIEDISVFRDIVSLAASLEKQETLPRYGWEKGGKIILPQEIYSEKEAKEFLDKARKVFDLVSKILSTCPELKERIRDEYQL